MIGLAASSESFGQQKRTFQLPEARGGVPQGPLDQADSGSSAVAPATGSAIRNSVPSPSVDVTSSLPP